MNLKHFQTALLVAIILSCLPAHGRRHFASHRSTWETPKPRTVQPDRRSGNRATGTRYEATQKRSERRRLNWSHVQDFPRADRAFKNLLQSIDRGENTRLSIIGHQGWGVGKKPLYRLDLPAVEAGNLRSSTNKTLKRPLRVLISSKIHGDETVGKVVVQRLVERALKDKKFRASFDLTILPELNILNRRLAPGLVNLNRTFPPRKTRATNRDVLGSLAGQRFDLFVGLHASVKDGFFLIRNQDDGGMSRRILGAMNSAVLLDAPADNNKVGAYELHCLGGAQSNNPGTFKGYMAQQRGVPYSYTLEASRMLSPEQQVKGAYKLLLSTLHNVARHGTFPGPGTN